MSEQENTPLENQETEIPVDKKAKKRAFWISFAVIFVFWLIAQIFKLKTQKFSIDTPYEQGYWILGPFLSLAFWVVMIQFFVWIIGKIFKVKKRWGITYFASFLLFLTFCTLIFLCMMKSAGYLERAREQAYISQIRISDDGNLVIPKTDNVKLNNKVEKFLQYIEESRKKSNKIIADYELKTTGEEVYESKERLKQACKDLDFLINFVKNKRDTVQEIREKKWEEIFGKKKDFSKKLGKGSEAYRVISERIKMYEAQKKLYKFHLENYEVLQKPTSWEEDENKKIIKKYITLFDEYEAKMKYFEQEAEKYRNDVNKKFQNIGK